MKHIYESRRATMSSPPEWDDLKVCDICERPETDVSFDDERTDICSECVAQYETEADEMHAEIES